MEPPGGLKSQITAYGRLYPEPPDGSHSDITRLPHPWRDLITRSKCQFRSKWTTCQRSDDRSFPANAADQ